MIHMSRILNHAEYDIIYTADNCSIKQKINIVQIVRVGFFNRYDLSEITIKQLQTPFCSIRNEHNSSCLI